MILHKKAFGIYHWDTFDDETILVDEKDTLAEAKEFIKHKYEGRISKQGADKVEIVDLQGNIVKGFWVT